MSERPTPTPLPITDVIHEQARLIEPKSRDGETSLDVETYMDLQDELRGLIKKFITDPSEPNLSGFNAEILHGADEYYQETKLEKALVYAYTHMGEAVESQLEVARLRAESNRLQAGQDRKRFLDLRQEGIEHATKVARWQQAAIKTVQQLGASGEYPDVLETFWHDTEDFTGRWLGEKGVNNIKTHILSTIMTGRLFERMRVKTYLPPAELDALKQIDLIGVPTGHEGNEILFIQNKGRTDGDMGFKVEVFDPFWDSKMEDQTKLDFLKGCERYARMWQIRRHLPLWVTASGIGQLKGSASQTGNIAIPDDVYAQVVARLKGVRMRENR
jgi:hypothetical protein